MRRVLPTIAAALIVAPAAAAHNPDPLGELKLKGPEGKGLVTLFDHHGAVAMTITARGLPKLDDRYYGVWLTGGPKPLFLGFPPDGGRSGKFVTKGPEASLKFTRQIKRAERVVVTLEGEDVGARPGRRVLHTGLAAALG